MDSLTNEQLQQQLEQLQKEKEEAERKAKEAEQQLQKEKTATKSKKATKSNGYNSNTCKQFLQETFADDQLTGAATSLMLYKVLQDNLDLEYFTEQVKQLVEDDNIKLATEKQVLRGIRSFVKGIISDLNINTGEIGKKQKSKNKKSEKEDNQEQKQVLNNEEFAEFDLEFADENI